MLALMVPLNSFLWLFHVLGKLVWLLLQVEHLLFIAGLVLFKESQFLHLLPWLLPAQSPILPKMFVHECNSAIMGYAAHCRRFLAAGGLLRVMRHLCQCIRVIPSSCNGSTWMDNSDITGASPCCSAWVDQTSKGDWNSMCVAEPVLILVWSSH